VPLDEEKARALARDLRHIALLGSYARELPELVLQGRRRRDPRAVVGALDRATRLEHALDPGGSERLSHGADQRDAQLGVGIGKQAISLGRELPVLRRTPQWNRTLLGSDELLPLQHIEMLSHGHPRQTQLAGESSGIERPFGLEQLDDGAASPAFPSRAGGRGRRGHAIFIK
jgi:hypothetical protein